MSVSPESLQDYINVMLTHPAAGEFRRLIRVNVFDEWMRLNDDDAKDLKQMLLYEERFFSVAATKHAADVDLEN